MDKKANSHSQEKQPSLDKDSLSGAYPTDLRDRQSVRTTFKISQDSVETIGILAKHHGVSFKEIFDNLSTQFLKERFLKKLANKEELEQAPLLQQLAHIAEKYMAQKGDQYADRQKGLVRKSQVVSRGALRTLNEVSKEYQIPRDLLVDWSLVIMRDKFEKDIKATREKYQEAYEIIAELNSHASNAVEKLWELLDPDDPILERFASVGAVLEDLHSAIKSNLDNGTPIGPEPFS